MYWGNYWVREGKWHNLLIFLSFQNSIDASSEGNLHLCEDLTNIYIDFKQIRLFQIHW